MCGKFCGDRQSDLRYWAATKNICSKTEWPMLSIVGAAITTVTSPSVSEGVPKV